MPQGFFVSGTELRNRFADANRTIGRSPVPSMLITAGADRHVIDIAQVPTGTSSARRPHERSAMRYQRQQSKPGYRFAHPGYAIY